MTEVSFDSNAFGIPASDDHRADVCGPGAGYAIPLMMGRKFFGQTAAKVVRLADIYRIPSLICGELAKNVNATDGVEGNATDGKVRRCPA